jgi:nucleoside-diphosphate-sugar epimerase
VIFIVGANGLVGSSFVRFCKKKKYKFRKILRKNNSDYFGKSCNILVIACGNSNKTLANKNPRFDFEETVQSVIPYIYQIKYKKIVFFSSVDYYLNTKSYISTSENIKTNFLKNNNYGFHKYIVEQIIKKFCNNYLIFRLGGLVGSNLKKNPIYDIFFKKKIFTSIKSRMNFINTNCIPKIVFNVLKKKIKNKVFNLASKDSLTIKKILKNLNIKDLKVEKGYEKNIQTYRINTKKIQKLLKLPSTMASIKHYKRQIKNEKTK